MDKKTSVWLTTTKHNELIMLFYNKRTSGKLEENLFRLQ